MAALAQAFYAYKIVLEDEVHPRYIITPLLVSPPPVPGRIITGPLRVHAFAHPPYPIHVPHTQFPTLACQGYLPSTPRRTLNNTPIHHTPVHQNHFLAPHKQIRSSPLPSSLACRLLPQPCHTQAQHVLTITPFNPLHPSHCNIRPYQHRLNQQLQHNNRNHIIPLPPHQH